MELGLAIIVIGALLLLLVIYTWAYLPEFRRNRRQAIFAFTVILPLLLLGLWWFFSSLI